MGQVHPTRGQLSVNGVSLANYSTNEWLSLITSVPQDPFLFRASIRDNVAISKPDATESEIENALTLAHADEFVSALTKGKETLIGEDGATLSGGQRQRLAIARALLRPAPFVILDEFTAHLDPHTESAVIASLRPVLATRTVLMIAHREATLTLADRVIELSLPKQEARVQ
jgi:ABC-type multidrug transport system fused ATPase/permease subunit